MHKYFFDTRCGGTTTQDNTGLGCSTPHDAHAAALKALADLVGVMTPDEEGRQEVSTDVRDETGRVIYTATLVGRRIT